MNNNYIVLILSKDISDKVTKIATKLVKNNIDYLIICDFCSINDDATLINNGFYNLTKSPYIKKPSAWDKSFYKIKEYNLLDRYDYFYFIEDDVYSKNYEKLISFIIDIQSKLSVDFVTKKIKDKNSHPSWKHWKEDYINAFKNPYQSFNPICRLSSKFIKIILEYQIQNNKFNFHEILFASLCIEYGLTYTNYIDDSLLNTYIGNIRYYPIMTESEINDELIYHPVKDSKSDREKSIVSLDKRR